MPKIISGGYNLGKIKLTTRVNAFEKRNPSEFLRQLFIKEQLKAKKKKK